jgi:hypothetical protein
MIGEACWFKATKGFVGVRHDGGRFSILFFQDWPGELIGRGDRLEWREGAAEKLSVQNRTRNAAFANVLWDYSGLTEADARNKMGLPLD